MVNSNETLNAIYYLNQHNSAITLETIKETSWKLQVFLMETVAIEIDTKSFLYKNNKTEYLINCFIDNSHRFDIELLFDDKKWISNICFDISYDKLKVILSFYTCHWKSCMNDEPLPQKKQNIGRNRSNTWLREYLCNSNIKEKDIFNIMTKNITDGESEKIVEYKKLLSILCKCCNKLSIPLDKVLNDFLSENDKQDIINGYISEQLLTRYIEIWINDEKENYN